MDNKKDKHVFHPQYYEIREVGKTIKSTKLQYIWRFNMDGTEYTVELFTSKLTSKKKLIINGACQFDDKM
jgi:hypothetical protein